MTQSSDPGPSASRSDFTGDARERRRRIAEMQAKSSIRRDVLPTPEDLRRRRFYLTLAKWLLPSISAVLLLGIGIWPEITHLVYQNRAILHHMHDMRNETGNIQNAVYHGIDAHDRPYTLTSRQARQMNNDHIDLTDPIADIRLSHGKWVHVRADKGVYMQRAQTLTLDGHVVLYRSDGLLMNSPATDIDLRRDIFSSSKWVHAEGTFGTQDAEGYFFDHPRNLIEFWGPGLSIHFQDRHNEAQS